MNITTTPLEPKKFQPYEISIKVMTQEDHNLLMNVFSTHKTIKNIMPVKVKEDAENFIKDVYTSIVEREED